MSRFRSLRSASPLLADDAKGRAMTLITFHVVLHKGFQNEEVMRRVVSAAGLTSVNEERARFFEFSVITGQGEPGARQLLERMPEVKAVKEDGEKHAVSGQLTPAPSGRA